MALLEFVRVNGSLESEGMRRAVALSHVLFLLQMPHQYPPLAAKCLMLDQIHRVPE